MQGKIDFSRIDWQNVLAHLGVEARLIENPKRRGPCPIEQTGSTRFRFDNKDGRGTWVCNCGAGDGVRLVALVNGIDDAEAARRIRQVIHGYPAYRQAPRQFVPAGKKTPEAIEKARKGLDRVRSGSKSITAETPAWKYLCKRVRGLELGWLSKALRYHPHLKHVDEDLGGCVTYRTAIVCDVVDAFRRDRIVTIHRTYITADGEKAPVSAKQVKKVMTATVDKLCGEVIAVNTAGTKFVIIAEGLEAALAWVAATQNRYTVFAALNCFNMSQFQWPGGTEAILVAADNDPPNPRSGVCTGQHYGAILKDRAIEAGLRARMLPSPVVGVDFDDLWNEGNTEMFDLRRLAMASNEHCGVASVA